MVEHGKGGAGMPNETSFAELFQKLVKHNYEADPEQLARTRSNLITQLSALRPTDGHEGLLAFSV